MNKRNTNSIVIATPFEVNLIKLTKSKEVDSEGNNYIIERYSNGEYIIMYDKLDILEDEFTFPCYKLLKYLKRRLIFGSNLVTFDKEEFISRYKLAESTFYDAIKIFIRLGILSKYRKNHYIVNHNIIFKGNIVEFIKTVNTINNNQPKLIEE